MEGTPPNNGSLRPERRLRCQIEEISTRPCKLDALSPRPVNVIVIVLPLNTPGAVRPGQVRSQPCDRHDCQYLISFPSLHRKLAKPKSTSTPFTPSRLIASYTFVVDARHVDARQTRSATSASGVHCGLKNSAPVPNSYPQPTTSPGDTRKSADDVQSRPPLASSTNLRRSSRCNAAPRRFAKMGMACTQHAVLPTVQ